MSTPAAKPASPPEARFVGGATCAGCHAAEAAAWGASHHARALLPAGPTAILGDFADASAGGARFTRSSGDYLASFEGHDYQVTHTLGVSPLQQVLVPFPGGRLQALPVAWDSRPAPAGQRWFHLQPGETIPPGDPLHWTGATLNWNYMCADCHSTNVRKGYDLAKGTYATTFAEMSVSCEACHGPGSRHVAWAAGGGGEDRGLLVALDERRDVSWIRDGGGEPRRSTPRRSEREIETCARCHSRRGILHEDHVHGQPAGDDYRVALLDDDLYHPDGQIKGEVYEVGSFLQSRMYAEGVTCSDCHEPHSGELRASGDQVCLRCHAPTYATADHHLHREGSPGSSCIACHMPGATFMVVDLRHDHSLRVPRPDLSVKLGVPNACNACHADRSAAWAARVIARKYGHPPAGFQRYAEALAAGAKGGPDATKLLVALAADVRQPAIARASALTRMSVNATTLAAVRTALRDGSSLVRRAVASYCAGLDPASRVPLLTPLLADPVRSVRIEAAMQMADVPIQGLTPSTRAAFENAEAELVASQVLNGDRPEAHLDLALLHAKQGRYDEAEVELKRALALDPAFAPAAVNLADLHRATGRDLEAGDVLREALRLAPREPALQHALGLWMIRRGEKGEALALLETAARSGAAVARYGYVYAVALHDAGKTAEARAALDALLDAHPFDRDALSAQVAFRREGGDVRGALRAIERLEALDPEDPQVQRIAEELRAAIRDGRRTRSSAESHRSR